MPIQPFQRLGRKIRSGSTLDTIIFPTRDPPDALTVSPCDFFGPTRLELSPEGVYAGGGRERAGAAGKPDAGDNGQEGQGSEG